MQRFGCDSQRAVGEEETEKYGGLGQVHQWGSSVWLDIWAVWQNSFMRWCLGHKFLPREPHVPVSDLAI
jgi:hypothetical protein